jgi:cysteine synthase A
MSHLIKDNTLQLIGNTPLVALDRIYQGASRLLAKAEFMQPGGSVKDRAAKQIIECAYRDGVLRRGQTVVEMTSGNMGAGLAVVCNVTGNPFVAVMSEGNSPARVKMLESLGAKVVLVPQIDGFSGRVTGSDIKRAVEEAVILTEQNNAFYVDQFNNPNSLTAHEQGTGLEIWNALGGKVDAFVASVGSGGTFVGTSKFLKRMKRDVVCLAVEPAGAEVLAGKSVTKPQHLLQGMGYGYVPP